MPAPPSAWLVFAGEVFSEGSLGARAILCSAARADFARSISDDPNRPTPGALRPGVSLLRVEATGGRLGLVGVVLVDLFDLRKCSVVFTCDPFDNKRAARRFTTQPGSRIEPSGNAIAAATPSRSGISALISDRSGNAFRISAHDYELAISRKPPLASFRR